MTPFLPYLQAFCRSTIVLVFAYSFLGKVSHMGSFRQTIGNFALLPRRMIRPAAYFFLSSEALVVVLLLAGTAFIPVAYLVATALLLLFSLAILSVLIRHISTSCSCFGSSTKPVSSIDLVRNGGLITCAVCGYITQAASGPDQHVLTLVEWGLVGICALVFVFIWTQLGEVIQLFQ